MDATQKINDSDEEENKEGNENTKRKQLAKLCVLKNQHIPETELPLFLGDNVLGRDPNTCTLPLPAASISRQHATICISVYRRRGCHSKVDIEALVWDQGTMNGTRKGHIKLTPNVRYALSDGDSLVLADIPCRYVSCAVNTDSSQGDVRTPVSGHLGIKARLPDASGEKASDTSTGSKECANSGTNLRVSLTKTPVKPFWLWLAKQTPTPPQVYLVLDSDEETEGGGYRRHKAVDCFSPTSLMVPESPIIPSSSNKNNLESLCLSKEENNKKTLAIVDNSEEEEESIAPGGSKSDKSEEPVPVKQESSVSLTAEEQLSASTSALSTDVIHAFNMDSDTDVEGEEEGVASVGPVTLNTNQVSQPQNTNCFHLDSDTDTDIDENEDGLNKASKTVPSSDSTGHPHVISNIQPESFTMNREVDDDDDAAVPDATTKAKPLSFQSACIADSVFSMQPKNIHLESDIDEDEGECTPHKSSSKPYAPRLDIMSVWPKSSHAAPQNLYLESDTDDEEILAHSEPFVISVATESRTTASSVSPSNKLEVLQSASDADTDVDEFSMIPALDGDGPANIRVGGDTNVENNEADIPETSEGQVLSLCREEIPVLLLPPSAPKCSTPLQTSGIVPQKEVEDMETQAFTFPPSVPFSSASFCSDNEEQEHFVVAETQSFIVQTRDSQSDPSEDHTMDPNQPLVLESSSDEKEEQSSSSYLQCQAQALAMECTQAFVSVGECVVPGGTRTYAAISTADRTSAKMGSNLETTQANREPSRHSVKSEKDGQVDLTLEATQSYILEPTSDSVEETDEDERKHSTSETQPLDLPTTSTLAMAETQPLPAFEKDENLSLDKSVFSVVQVKPTSHHETEEKEEHGEAAQPQQRLFSEALYIAETQPVRTYDDEESDEEDSISGPLKAKGNPLQLEEGETHLCAKSALSIVETQPMQIGLPETQAMATSGNEDSDDEDSVPWLRKQNAKQQRLKQEKTQMPTNSEGSPFETQPMVTGGDGESDEDDSLPVFRKKRKAKPLQLEEETPPPISSQVFVAETQPMGACEGELNDEEDLIPGPPKTKAKPLQLKEEEIQPLSNSEVSTGDPLPLETKTGVQPKRGRGRRSEADTSGISVRNKRGARGRLRRLGEEVDVANPRQQEVTEEREADKREMEESELERQRRKEELVMLEKERIEREEQQRLDKERTEKEKHEQLQAENAARIRSEQEKAEKERRQKEEKERSDQIKKEKEQLRERKENIEKERLANENAERQEKEKLKREEKERMEKERKDQEEKERLEAEKRKLEERHEKEQEHQARLEREAEEKEEKKRLEKDKKAEEKQVKELEEKKPTVATRGRRASTRRVATKPEQDSTISTNDDVPARRTRSRSHSSNSASSERSASSISTQESRGRGQGRGVRRTSEPPQAAISRRRNNRRTVALTTQQDSNDISPLGVLSRSNSSNSLNSEFSSCSVRSRGGRRKTQLEPDFIPPVDSPRDQTSAPKPAARGRKSRNIERSFNELSQEKEKADFQQARATRGRQQASANPSEPAAPPEEDQSTQKKGHTSEESPQPKKSRGRGQKAVKSETLATRALAVSDGDDTKDKRKGRKRELVANTEEELTGRKEKAKITGEEEEVKDETKDENPVPSKRRGRVSSAQAKRNAKESPPEVEAKEESVQMEEETEKRARSRSSAALKKKKEEQADGGTCVTSMNQDAKPHTATSSVSRKRQAPAASSPVAKTHRASTASPEASGRLRPASQAYKVLFTGVVDDTGERVVALLGGSMAEGVADMNCLVTDKVRRTVKFLCAVAKGVPIVTTHWLEKCRKAGSFLSTNAFVVKDPEQENKFSFCLQESLRAASSHPLLQGYKIHVTKSVKPEPVQMKDIISCSGGTFLPKMPSYHKPQTIVISCKEDWPLCGPAVSASLPVVTAEFILTGILQQKLDFQTHALDASANL